MQSSIEYFSTWSYIEDNSLSARNAERFPAHMSLSIRSKGRMSQAPLKVSKTINEIQAREDETSCQPLE